MKELLEQIQPIFDMMAKWFFQIFKLETPLLDIRDLLVTTYIIIVIIGKSMKRKRR